LYAHVPHWSSQEAEGRLARDPSQYVSSSHLHSSPAVPLSPQSRASPYRPLIVIFASPRCLITYGKKLTIGLPFQSDCNTGFGIVFSYYLNVTLYNYRESPKDTTPKSPDSVDSETNAITDSNKDSDTVKQAKEDALKAVEVTFESVKGARQEVERGFRFWDAVRLLFYSTLPQLYSYTLSVVIAANV
jgi:hypothetical protein